MMVDELVLSSAFQALLVFYNDIQALSFMREGVKKI